MSEHHNIWANLKHWIVSSGFDSPHMRLNIPEGENTCGPTAIHGGATKVFVYFKEDIFFKVVGAR